MSKAFSDFYFLITMDKMGKALNGKYKDGKIEEVGTNEDTKDTKYFRVIFALNGKKYEVIAFINKKTFNV